MLTLENACQRGAPILLSSKLAYNFITNENSKCRCNPTRVKLCFEMECTLKTVRDCILKGDCVLQREVQATFSAPLV